MTTQSLDKVYLAGPVQSAADRGVGWRERLKENHDEFEWLDPLEGQAEQYDDVPYTERTDVVPEDLAMVGEADALLVHWELTPTCGTPMEMMYKRLQDPQALIVVQTTVGYEDISPWLRYHADYICETFSGAIGALKEQEAFLDHIYEPARPD